MLLLFPGEAEGPRPYRFAFQPRISEHVSDLRQPDKFDWRWYFHTFCSRVRPKFRLLQHRERLVNLVMVFCLPLRLVFGFVLRQPFAFLKQFYFEFFRIKTRTALRQITIIGALGHRRRVSVMTWRTALKLKSVTIWHVTINVSLWLKEGGSICSYSGSPTTRNSRTTTKLIDFGWERKLMGRFTTEDRGWYKFQLWKKYFKAFVTNWRIF